MRIIVLSILALGLVATAVVVSTAPGVVLDPKVVSYTLPDGLEWRDNASGTNQTVTLYGDPTRPEPYAMLIRWKAGNMSRPHSHPNDRIFLVLSGTWWVGTDSKFDPDATVPMPAGSYVVHHAKGVHFDGAKEGDTVIMVHGMGPATTSAAEQK
jgi:quercetin dioxygenase-like cupin family protein